MILCAVATCAIPQRHTTTCKTEGCSGCLPAQAAHGLVICDYHTRQIAPHATEAARLWSELEHRLYGSTGGIQEIRTTSPDPGLKLNMDVVKHRTLIRHTLVGWTKLIAEQRGHALPWRWGPWKLTPLPAGIHGPLNRHRTRTIDHTTARLGQYIAKNAQWLAAREYAPDAIYELTELVDTGRRLNQPSNISKVKVGSCPATDGERRCAGKLIGYMRPTDSILPSAVTCDTNPDHTWDSTQWTKLGRTMGAAA